MIVINDPTIITNKNYKINYINFDNVKYFININYISLNDDIKVIFNIGAKKYKFILYYLALNTIIILPPEYFINFQCNKLYKTIMNYVMLITIPMINEMF